MSKLWPNLTRCLDFVNKDEAIALNDYWVYKVTGNESFYDLIVRCKDGLRVFKYNEASDDWIQLLCDDRFSAENKFNEEKHKINIFNVNTDVYMVFLSYNSGYVFVGYNPQTNKIQEVLHDSLFVRSYRQLNWGYFYGTENPLGLFAIHEYDGISFHYVNVNSKSKPVWSHDSTNKFLKQLISLKQLDWNHNEMSFLFVNVKADSKTYIVCQSNKDLSIYELNEAKSQNEQFFQPNKLLQLNMCAKNENQKFWFAAVTPVRFGCFKNLVVLKADGLYVFDLNDGNCQLIAYSSTFSEQYGWNSRFNASIKFEDYDNSGVEKVIYTDGNGLRIDKLIQISSVWYWVNLVDFQFSPYISERYMLTVNVIPSLKSPINKPIIIGHDLFSNKPMIMPIDSDDEFEVVDVADNDGFEVIDDLKTGFKVNDGVYPSFDNSLETSKKAILYFRDTLDITKLISSSVNIVSGSVSLTVPIVKLQILKDPLLRIDYSSNSTSTTSILGQGWSMQHEFIYAANTSSTSRYNHQYFLFSSTAITAFVCTHDEPDITRFTLQNDKSIEITYHSREQCWKVVNSTYGYTFIYGGGITAANSRGNGIEWQLGHKNPQNGSCSYSSCKWYLTYYSSKSQNIEIKYSFKELTTNDVMPLTKGIYLENMSLNNNEIKVALNYKNNYELVETVKLETQLQILTLNFNYKKDAQTTILESISQIECNNEKVLQFSYERVLDSMKLMKILLPDKQDVLSFSYAIVHGGPFNVLKDKPLQCQNASHQIRLASSIDYLIVTELLHMLNEDLLKIHLYNKVNYSDTYHVIELSSNSLNHKILNYDVYAFPEFFIVYIYSHDESFMQIQSVYLYHRDSNYKTTWVIDSSYSQSNLKMLTFNSQTVVAILNNGSRNLITLEWNDEENKWYESFQLQLSENDFRDVVMTINEENTILVYGDESTKLIYRGLMGKWKVKQTTNTLSYLQELRSFVNSFDINDDLRKIIFKHFKQNFIHYTRNVIIFNRIYIANHLIYSVQTAFITDASLNIVLQRELSKTTSILGIECKQEMEFENKDKVEYCLTYAYVKNKYQVVFKKSENVIEYDFHNKEYKRIYEFSGQDIKFKVQDHHGYIVKGSEKSFSPFKNDSKSSFFVDLDEFFVKLRGDKLSRGKEIFEFDGSKWSLIETIEKANGNKIEISESLSLSKEDKEDNLKLVNNKANKILFDFKIKNTDDIIVVYPNYIAYKASDDSAWVLVLSGSGKIATAFKITDKCDYVISGSNQYLLAVKHLNHVMFYPNPASLTNSEFEIAVVSEKQVQLDNATYSTGYEFKSKSFSSYRSISFLNCRTYPAKAPEVYGYIDHDMDVASGIIITYYDSKGQIVKTENTNTEEPISENDEDYLKPTKNDTVLFANDCVTEIIEFYNVNICDDEADYYGFESYESNGKWQITNAELIKGYWPLMGATFLRLNKPNSSISRVFKPKNIEYVYECSCWIRFAVNLEIPNLHEIFAEFSAIFSMGDYNKTLNSQVLSKYQDWIFLRIVVNLPELIQAAKYNTVSIKVEIKSSKTNNQIDVDHIRWLPLNNRFQLNVYDEVNNQLICTMKENNRINHLLQDAYYQPFAIFNSDNQLQSLTFSYNNAKSILTVEASNATLQVFSDYCFKNHWIIENKLNKWKRNGKRLLHCGTGVSSLKLTRNFDINLNHNSLAIYFHLVLLNQRSSIQLKLNFHEIIFKQSSLEVNGAITVNNCKINDGYYFIVAERSRLIIWLNNDIIVDKGFNLKNFDGQTSNLEFRVEESVCIYNLLILSDPKLTVDHMNSLRKVTQTVLLESDKTVIITERLYDQLEREAAVTKSTRVTLSHSTDSLAYFKTFVTNNAFNQNNSFWKTGELTGIVSALNPNDENYCYYRNVFSDSPCNYIQKVDYPGKEFSSKQMVITKNDEWLYNNSYLHFKNLFPPEHGFSQTVNDHFNGNKTVTFYDKNSNKVAIFNHTLGFQDILTTYEYDKNDNLVKILPPLYHSNEKILTLEQVGVTYEQLKAKWQSDSYATNLQSCLANTFVYNKYKLIGTSYAPDSGYNHYIYNKLGLLRYVLKCNKQNEPYILEYTKYNNWSEIAEKGFCMNKNYFNLALLNSLANEVYEDPSEFCCLQDCYISSCIETGYNGKRIVSRVKTIFNNFECKEDICYVNDKNITQKEVLLQVSPDQSMFFRFEKHYSGSKLSNLLYPIAFKGKLFNLIYKYNKQGLVSSIGYQRGNNDINGSTFVEFNYTASGLLSDETFYSTDSSNELLFNRQYEYQSAEFLKSISDSFQKEYLSYNQNGYGGSRYYDGTVAKTKFEPSWHDKCDPRTLCLSEEVLVKTLENVTNEEASYLLKLLSEKGYLDKRYRVINEFCVWDAMLFLPFKYSEETIKSLIKLINSYFPIHPFGHRYSYGNFMELINAKYFVNSDNHDPISFDSFVSAKIDLKTSKKIWDILLTHQFIWIDSDNTNCTNTFGKVDIESFVDSVSLNNVLTKSSFTGYTRKLIVLLQYYYGRRITLDEETFIEIFENWNINHEKVTQQQKRDYKEIGKQLWKLLSSHGYLYSNRCALFKFYFYEVLSTPEDFTMYLPEIVSVLCDKASKQIGTSSADLRCLHIDGNGNHRLYRDGFDKFELKYSQLAPNQISQVIHGHNSYKVDHDNLGNVVRAEHKGIVNIKYDPISNRAVEFTLQNNTRVLFNYDSRNERVYKCVINKFNIKEKEIFYLRDQNGRTLVEKEVTYNQDENIENESLVAFIYGPRGLLGYIKDEEFYHVVSDHEHSVRLIVKNNVVVAAFDYSSYGNLIREYGSEAKQFRYRFTGQEWDSELGLYNYHARFYDPKIGRFYQTDAKDQYASPYKYAGNSPVSMVDPDGNEAILLALCIIGLIGGAYLGGAAANDDWRIWKWEFNKVGTWFGIITGGICGFLLPQAFVLGSATIAATFGTGLATTTLITCGLGAAGIYISMSLFRSSFNPKNWQWKKPGLWNAAFQGFASGVSLPTVLSNWHTLYLKHGYFFLFLSLGTGVVFGYFGAASANNSFNPTKWKLVPSVLGFCGGAWTGFFLFASIKSSIRANQELLKTANKIFRCVILIATFVSTTTFALLSVYMLYESLPDGTSFMTLLKMPSTYEALISGALFGYGLPSLLCKTIPDAWKGYKGHLLKDLKTKLYKYAEDQAKMDNDTIQEFIKNRKQRFQDSANKIRQSKEYIDLTAAEKAKIDDIINKFETEVNTAGRITSKKIWKSKFKKNLEQNLSNMLDIYSKPLDGNKGCYCVMRLNDGNRKATIICHSSSKEIYNVTITDNGQTTTVSSDTQNVANESLNKMYNAMDSTKKWPFDNNNYTANNRKIDPKSCAEFRAGHIIAAHYNFKQKDIVSITAFEVNSGQPKPYLRCEHCQVTFKHLSLTQVATDITDKTVVRNISHINQMLRTGFNKMFYQEIKPMLYIFHINNLTVNVEVARNKQKQRKRLKKE